MRVSRSVWIGDVVRYLQRGRLPLSDERAKEIAIDLWGRTSLRGFEPLMVAERYLALIEIDTAKKETDMDDPTKKGAADSLRINVNQPHEIAYWTKALGVSEGELRRAVAKAGVMVEDVRAFLKKVQG